MTNMSFFYMFFMSIFIPYCVYAWLFTALTYFQHTSPDIPWFKNEKEWNKHATQALIATHVTLPSFLNRFYLNVFSHTAHHDTMNIPLYKLQHHQKELADTYKDKLPVYIFSMGWLLNLFKKCQLYDYEHHRWLDFNGNTTTASIKLT